MRTIAWLLVLITPVLAQQALEPEPWTRCCEAWKELDRVKGEPVSGILDDSFLKATAQVHACFSEEARSLLPEEEREILKGIFKARLRFLVEKIAGGGSLDTGRGELVFNNRGNRIIIRGGNILVVNEEEEDDWVSVPEELERMENGLAALDEGGLGEVVAALQRLEIIPSDWPPWRSYRLQRLLKALARGEAYPEPPQPDEQTAARVKALICDLGSPLFEVRKAATEALLELGELAAPALRTAAAEHEDPEIRARAQAILGIR